MCEWECRCVSVQERERLCVCALVWTPRLDTAYSFHNVFQRQLSTIAMHTFLCKMQVSGKLTLSKRYSQHIHEKQHINSIYSCTPIHDVHFNTQTTTKGSLSTSDTMTCTLVANLSTRRLCTTLRNPRSVLEWSQRTTCVPLQAASSTSWWDISPVRYRSAFTPWRTLAPDPAHTATVLISIFSEKMTAW